MHDTKGYQNKNLSQYPEAILRCSDKKICPNLTNELDIKSDSIYRGFVNSINQPDSTSIALQGLASKALLGDKKYAYSTSKYII